MLNRCGMLFPFLSLLVALPAFAQITSLPGFPKTVGGYMGRPSPAVLDINGDGQMEIFGANGSGYVFSVDSQGSLKWITALPSSTCPTLDVANRTHSSPAISDLDGDGDYELAIGYGAIGHTDCKGGMAFLDAHTGAIIRKLDSVKLKTKLNFWAIFPTVYSTPMISDLDSNGLKEIFWGSYDRHMYAYTTSPTGKIKLKYYYQAADTIWSSAAAYDYDGDGEKEIFIGSDISQNTEISPPTPNGGYMYSLKATPVSDRQLQLFRTNRAVNWYKPVDQTIFSPPTIADVLPKNPGPELIVGTGYYFQGEVGKYFKIYRLSDGKTLKTIPVGAASSSQAAVGDLDGDGKKELVLTIDNGEVRAVRPKSKATMWSFQASWNEVGHTSPLIADLDCNGSLEVIFADTRGVKILSGQTGSLLATLPVTSGYSTPTIADINADGQLDIVLLSGSTVYAYTNFGSIGSSTTTQTQCAVPVGMFRFNAARTGVFGEQE
jgi:hypothetical protein